MKTLKISGLIAFATLLLSGCTKDDNGNYVKYYKHVTGEGYVFYKYLDGSIAPCKNGAVHCVAQVYENIGMGGINPSTLQIVNTNDYGKFSCKFAKKIKDFDMNYYAFRFYDFETVNYDNHWFIPHGRGLLLSDINNIIEIATKNNPQTINIDTIWLEEMQ